MKISSEPNYSSYVTYYTDMEDMVGGESLNTLDVLEKYPWASRVGMLHYVVADSVEYYDGRDSIPSADEVMRTMRGNCEGQCILLGSMLHSIDLPIRFIVAKDPTDGGGHLSLEVGTPGYMSADEFASNLYTFYTDYLDPYDYSSSDLISWESDKGRDWFVADPVMSSYVGDTEGLRRSGFVVGSEYWTWEDAREYQEIYP